MAEVTVTEGSKITDEDVKKALQACMCIDEDEEFTQPIDVSKSIKLSADEVKWWQRELPSEIKEADTELYICEEFEDKGGHLVLISGEAPNLKATEIVFTCAISMEVVPAPSAVQYQYEDDEWRLSKIGASSCAMYRSSKFKVWEEMIKSPVCEASLRRMVQVGLITTLFDHLAFPNPEELEEKYQAKNEETNKIIQIPHPVQALRVWDSKTGGYIPFPSRLEGAPEPEGEEAYWNSILEYLTTRFPDEMKRIQSAEVPTSS